MSGLLGTEFLDTEAGRQGITACSALLQDAVSAGGPLLAILGFLILPLIWSVPEALITAELATTFPENSGYVAWVTAAFGPFWGFQVILLMPVLQLSPCASCPATASQKSDGSMHLELPCSSG